MDSDACREAPQLCLPRGYRRRMSVPAQQVEDFWTPERIRDSAVFQWHVYRWANRLIRREKLQSVLDVGCGAGRKIEEHILPVCRSVEGVDHPEAIRRAAEAGLRIPLHPADLEAPDIASWRTFDLVLCVDVLEHLTHPDRTLDLIRSFAHPQSLVLLSTPDRDRLRGRACRQSDKPDHVQEWAAPEFRRFLRLQGFVPIRWKLVPQTRLSVWKGLLPDALYRLRLRERSPLCCHAVLCRLASSVTRKAPRGADSIQPAPPPRR